MTARLTRASAAADAKLTEAIVTELRHRYAAGGVTQSTLAREFAVDQSVISDAIRGETWAHLDVPVVRRR